MKKRIFAIALLVAMFFSFAISVHAEEEEKVHTVKHAVFDVTLKEDGSADIVETWVVDFESGRFSRFRKEIYLDVSDKEKFSGVQDVAVWIDGVLCEESDTDGYLVEHQSDRVVISAYKESEHIVRTYQFAYTLTDIVKKLDDTHSYFSYRFVGKNNSVPIKNLQVTIHSPVKGVFSTDLITQGEETHIQDNAATYTAQDSTGLCRVAVNLETENAFGVPYTDSGNDTANNVVIGLFLAGIFLTSIIPTLRSRAQAKNRAKQKEEAQKHPEQLPVLIESLEARFTPGQILASIFGTGASIKMFLIMIAELIASGHVLLTEDETGILLNKKMAPPEHVYQKKCLALLEAVHDVLLRNKVCAGPELPLAEFVEHVAQKPKYIETRFKDIRRELQEVNPLTASPGTKEKAENILPHLSFVEFTPISFAALVESFRNKNNMTLRAFDFLCRNLPAEESAAIDLLLVPIYQANTIWIDPPRNNSSSDGGCSSCGGGCGGCGGCGGS